MASRALCIDQTNGFIILLNARTLWPEIEDACWEDRLFLSLKWRACDCLEAFWMVLPACGELVPQTSKYLRTPGIGNWDSANYALESMRALYMTSSV